MAASIPVEVAKTCQHQEQQKYGCFYLKGSTSTCSDFAIPTV